MKNTVKVILATFLAVLASWGSCMCPAGQPGVKQSSTPATEQRFVNSKTGGTGSTLDVIRSKEG